MAHDYPTRQQRGERQVSNRLFGSLPRLRSARVVVDMSKSCEGMLDDLVKCLEQTDCYLREKKSLKECAKDSNIAEECVSIRNGYFLCKRGQLDMRKRIRGNQGY